MCHPLKRHLPPNHDVGRVMASLHPQNAPQGTFEHKSCCSDCIQLLDGEKFLVREEDVFVPFPSVPLEEKLCSCQSDLLQIRSKKASFLADLSIVPNEARLDWVEMFSSRNMMSCFQNEFWRIHSPIVLRAASALTLFRFPDRALSSNPQNPL